MSRKFQHRKDANHGETCAALERMGWYIEDVSQSNLGYDVIITKAGRTERLEIKDGELAPSRRKLTPNEEKKQAALKQYGVTVLLVESLNDLAQLDRQARETVEGIPARDFYREAE